jgi:hypothetical protein
MSVSVVFRNEDGDDGPFQVASASGWKLLAEWAGDSGPVAKLCDEGRYANTSKLAIAFMVLMRKRPPAGPLKDIVDSLLKLIGVGDDDEAVEVVM